MGDDGDDPLRRRQRKAQAAAKEVSKFDDFDKFDKVLEGKASPDTLKEAADPAEERREKAKKDRLDYSRFVGIGDDDKQERMQTGNIGWDDLDKDEKKQVWEHEDKIEQMIDQKRQEEDDWKRQLREKPADLSWVQGKHFATYEAFCVGRVESLLKKQGNEAFKAGNYAEAQGHWEGGVKMLLALGEPPPEAWTLVCILRNNLAQLFMKQAQWNKVKEMTDKIIEREPTNEKALYRRAQTFYHTALWAKAEKDLQELLKHHPGNKEAAALFADVQRKLGRDKSKLGGKAVRDIAAGLEELVPDGTVRKLKIEDYGEGNPDERPTWVRPEYLQKGINKMVVTCQMVITSVGGEELYNSREYRPFPETKKARDELKEYMDMVQFLDEEAGKKPRLVGDFYKKVKKRPVRWHLGDEGMYKGFDLAVQSMKPKERSIFEVDQPMLSPSVEKHYEKLGFHSGLAGLPQLIYHIEEERLAILEDEVPEQELDLDSKTQRGVKVELELLAFFVYRDVSQNLDSTKLHGVLFPGYPNEPVVEKGMLVRGAFFITRPFDGSLLVQNQYVEWRLGEDEGKYAKEGENKEPLRPDGGSFVPRSVADALLSVDWVQLRVGCLVEVRVKVGPELHEIAPQYKKQFETARRENHKKGKKGGAPCSIMVQLFASDYPRPGADATSEPQQYLDESAITDMDIE